jgi:proliferating cell nuclear antigen PCNA
MSEIGLVFRSNGLFVTNFDKTEKILVHLNISNENLEFYECKRDNIIVGVDMKIFYTIANNLENSDILTIYIKESNYVEGVVKYLSFRSDKGEGQFKLQEMRVIDHDNLEIEYSAIEYRSVITMPSTHFQKIIKDAISSKYSSLEIAIIGDRNNNEIIFKSFNKDSCSEIHITEQNEQNNIGFVQTLGTEEVIKANFCCRTLLNFTKCTALSQTMELRLDNDGKPLVVKYLISNLGSINLCLLPLN